MLCKLERGILQVKEITGRDDAFFLIEGGFARVSLNNITILTHEAITFDEMDKEETEQMISDAKSVVVGKAYIKAQVGEVDSQKAAMIVKLAELSKVG
jgi:F0F1-type ATP synthase epsilon subunit